VDYPDEYAAGLHVVLDDELVTVRKDQVSKGLRRNLDRPDGIEVDRVISTTPMPAALINDH